VDKKMRIGDFLYFAPGIKFSELDLSGTGIAAQYEARIQGFYLNPSYSLVLAKHAFASGVLLVSCIDALAKLRYGNGVGERFKKWTREELDSFKDSEFARLFYDDFRNGLVHETRIKNGGEFSFEQKNTAIVYYFSLRVNPLYLHEEVVKALSRYKQELISDSVLRSKFVSNLRESFEQELAGV
jgi:hypothetical protein